MPVMPQDVMVINPFHGPINTWPNGTHLFKPVNELAHNLENGPRIVRFDPVPAFVMLFFSHDYKVSSRTACWAGSAVSSVFYRQLICAKAR